MPPTVTALTLDQLLALPMTFGIETAGQAWGIGRTKSRELHRAEQFPVPVKRLGARLVCTKADLFASLGLNLDGSPSGANSPAP